MVRKGRNKTNCILSTANQDAFTASTKGYTKTLMDKNGANVMMVCTKWYLNNLRQDLYGTPSVSVYATATASDAQTAYSTSAQILPGHHTVVIREALQLPVEYE